MFDDRLEKPWQGWSWYGRCRTKRRYNHVHDNENAKSIQERAYDEVAAQHLLLRLVRQIASPHSQGAGFHQFLQLAHIASLLSLGNPGDERPGKF